MAFKVKQCYTKWKLKQSTKQEREKMTKFQVLSLPDLVVEKILDYLDLTSLKRLRVVSKEMKSLVERPRFLKKFWINSSHMRKLEKSTVPWTSFLIVDVMWTGTTNGGQQMSDFPKEFQIFLNQFAPNARHIEVGSKDRLTSINLMSLLNNVTSNLESLKINFIVSDDSDELSLAFYREVLIVKGQGQGLPTLVGLKYLEISAIPYIHCRSENDTGWPMLDFILQSCPNLIFLKYPDNLRNLSKNRELHYDEHIYNPLLNYLQGLAAVKHNGSETEPSSLNLLGVEFGTGRQCLKSQTLLQIVELCCNLGIRLYNVPCSALISRDNERLQLTENQKMMLMESVISVQLSNLRELTNAFIPRTTKVNVRLTSPRKPLRILT